MEDAVEDLRNTLPELVAEMRRAPADAAARAELTAKLNDLVDDATLIDDAELVAQAQAALAELESGGTVELEAAVSAIADSGGAGATPAPAISAETQRLLAVDAKGLDAELLEIYLIEAAEVLDTVATNRAELERNPGDREALRSARRQFHTLKGSGRMVGLTELGELAWAVEKVHNRLLEEERAVSPAALAMIEVAETNFRRWIGALKDTGSVAADPAELHAAIGRVEAELPADAESAPQTPVVVAVRELPPVSAAAAAEPVAAAHSDRIAGSRSTTKPVDAGAQPAAWIVAPWMTARKSARRSSSSRRSARCPPAPRPTTEAPAAARCHRHRRSQDSGRPLPRPRRRGAGPSRDAAARAFAAAIRFRDCCRPRPWCARVIRCAGFTARAACR